MKHFMLMLFLLSTLFSCESNTAESNDQPKNDSPKVEEAFSISGKCIVFIRPDSATFHQAIEALKKEHGEDALAEIGSDEGLYNGQARDFAQEKGLQVHETDAKEISFQKEDGTTFRMSNSVRGYSPDFYMFDGVNKPKKVENIALFPEGEEFKAYFGAGAISGHLKTLQGGWADKGTTDPTEFYEGDIATFVPGAEYKVHTEGENIYYSPYKNTDAAASTFKRKIKKISDNEVVFIEKGGAEKTMVKTK
jgi:hypothetical protein